MNATKILPGLYQGSAPDSAKAVRRAGFGLLVLCAQEVQPPDHALDGLRVMRCPLLDVEEDLSDHDWRLARSTARRIANAIEHRVGALVTCAQGLNRSGLVVGFTVYELTGWDGHAIVDHIRRRRPNALFNQTFARALTGLHEKRRR